MSDHDVPAWTPSARFEDAVVYVARTHALQARKGGTVPYLAHLFAVASLVMENGGSEDETIAALLHDAAEDQGGEHRLQDIEAHFGSNVAAIVLGRSDTLEAPKPPWEERKRDYVADLPSATPEVIRVSLADKLYNARSMAADHALVGDALWAHFNAPRDAQAAYYRQLCDAFRARRDGGPMVAQLCATVEELFGLVSEREIPEILGTEGAIDGWWAPRMACSYIMRT